MKLFLVLTFLFFAGSIIGWILEVFWRRFFSKNNLERKWINPGFLTGPYLPLYGLSLCVLFLLSFINVSFIHNNWIQKIVLFILMAICITILEYIAGLIFIKGMHIKLWDYTNCRGNIKEELKEKRHFIFSFHSHRQSILENIREVFDREKKLH